MDVAYLMQQAIQYGELYLHLEDDVKAATDWFEQNELVQKRYKEVRREFSPTATPLILEYPDSE